MDMNNHYKKLRALLSQLSGSEAVDDLISDAMERAGTPVSKSKIQGWRVSPEHKNYRRMTSDELHDVLYAVTKYYNLYRCSRCGHIEGPDWLDDGETCPKCKLVQ